MYRILCSYVPLLSCYYLVSLVTSVCLWLKINEGENIAKLLQVFLQTYRSAHSSRTLEGKSPDELMIGRKLRTTPNLFRSPQTTNRINNSIRTMELYHVTSRQAMMSTPRISQPINENGMQV